MSDNFENKNGFDSSDEKEEDVFSFTKMSRQKNLIAVLLLSLKKKNFISLPLHLMIFQENITTTLPTPRRKKQAQEKRLLQLLLLLLF